MKKAQLTILILFFATTIVFGYGDAGKALDFRRLQKNVVTIAGHTEFNDLNNHYTIEFWVRRSLLAFQSRVLFSDSALDIYFLANGHLVFASNTGAGASLTSNSVLTIDSWHHVAIVCDGSNVTIYLDGAVDGTDSDPNYELPDFDTFYIGNNSAGNAGFAGELDEVRIWTTSRSAAQIADNLDTPVPVPATGLLGHYKFDGIGQTVTDSSGNGLNGVLGTTAFVQIKDPKRIDSFAKMGWELVSPNGGFLKIGLPFTITWVASGKLTKVNLLMSFDGGATWKILAYKIPNDGLYLTYVPGFVTNQALFKVMDPDDDTAFDASDNFIDISGLAWDWAKELIYEAEDGNIEYHMKAGVEGTAFNSGFIYSNKDNDGHADYRVWIPCIGGLYVIWGRVYSEGKRQNSFYVSVDGGPDYLMDLNKNSQWNGEYVTNRGNALPPYQAELDPLFFRLTPGFHKIRVKAREHFAKLDRLILTNDLSQTYFETAPEKWINLTSPADRDSVIKGEPWEITWETSSATGHVVIQLSYDKGETFPVTITDETENDGSFMWDVPYVDAEEGIIRIIKKNSDSKPMDQNFRSFLFIDPPERIIVESPNGGEEWQALSQQTVAWDSKSFTGLVNVEFSPDSGATWETIATNQPDSGSFNWLVPDNPTDRALVRIADAADGVPVDLSDSLFTILPVPEVQDYALQFDGLNDFAKVLNHPSLVLVDSFAIEFWFNTPSPIQGWTRILEKGAWDEYYLGFYGSLPKVYGGLRVLDENDVNRISTKIGPSLTDITASEWYHMAVTYDGTTVRTFINGILETTNDANVDPRKTTGDLVIGAVKQSGVYGSFFNGTLDELKIWNCNRSSAQVAVDMYALLTGAEANLAAYYNFNEGAGQVAADLSPNGNDMRLGLTDGVEDSDPTWVECDHPTAPAAPAAPAFLAKDSPDIIAAPMEFSLAQNYPNPFNPSTTISFTLEEENYTSLVIFDIQGRQVATLVNEIRSAGSHSVIWNAANITSGVYFYKLEAGPDIQIRRMLLLK